MKNRFLVRATRSFTPWNVSAIAHVTVSLVTLTLISLSVGSAYAQSSEPLKTVIPVHFDTATGNITVGSTTYKGTNPGVHLLALKRQPDDAHLDAPDLIDDGTFLNSSAAIQFLQTILGKSPDALLLVNAVGNYGFPVNALAGTLEQFGAQVDLESLGSAASLVLIGNGGQNKGEARQRGNSTLPVDGYLASDSNGNYRFIQTDYIRYDITTDGNITIGNKTYTVASSYKYCDGSNAFHLVVVNRESPDILIANNSYCTGQSDSEITHMLGDLPGVSMEDELVFIASNGHPIPANWNFNTDGDQRIRPLATDFAQFGGYWETLAYMTPTDTYSLVGSPPPPSYVGGARKRAKESSTVYPSHPTGELHGVLARGRGNWYSPLNADPSGFAELGFYQILAQTPVAYPHPANPAEVSAFQYINQQFSEQQGLCKGCNVRDMYADTNITISSYGDQLNGMKAPDGSDCSESQNAGLPFCIVRQQLSTEITHVKNIRAFNTNLNFLWNASATTSILQMLSTYNDLSANMPSPAAPAPSLVDPIVDLLLGIATYAPGVGDLFGIAEAAFSFGTGLTTDPSGNASTSLMTTVGQLQQQLAQRFIAQAAASGTQFDFIYQDWGKLSVLGSTLAAASQGSPWYWNGSGTAADVLQNMAPAIEVSYYQSLMAAVYAIGTYLPECANTCPAPLVWGQTPIWQQPQAYLVWDDNGPFCFFCPKPAQPFNYPWYPPYTYPTDPNNPIEIPSNPAYTQATATILGADQWLGISLQTSPSDSGGNGLYDPPPASVLNRLFTPRSSDGTGGLGVYRPAFFEGWPFPRVGCGPSRFSNGDIGELGCNWSAAAPPPEAVREPLTSLVAANAKSRNHYPVEGQLEIPVTIHNNGTVDIQSIQITNVSIRTLGGSAQAVLVDPVLPIQTGSVKPSASVTVSLHIAVPPGVQKIIVTEQGTADNGQLEPYRFSYSQAVFPGK